MLKKAKEKLSNSFEISPASRAKVRFVCHDLTRPWPLEDASVDLMFGNLVLEHLETLDFFFVEAARTLKPGGKLLVCELHPFKQYLVRE